MTTLTQLKKVFTLEDLEALNIGRVTYEVGGRGGYVGFYTSTIAQHFRVNPDYFPNKFGAYVNYLGGGVRGSITPSTFDKRVPKYKTNLLNALTAACVRVYENLEGELNEEEGEDGETNWDALATKAARNAGIESAY